MYLKSRLVKLGRLALRHVGIIFIILAPSHDLSSFYVLGLVILSVFFFFD